MNKRLKTIKQCPHWVDEEGHRECNISKGGLFIPLPQHIEGFCLSGHYPKCCHYVRTYQHLPELEMFVKSDPRDRRMNCRFGWKYSLYFSLLDEIDLHSENEQREAKSLDISLGGMRVISFDEISPQHLIAFSLGGEIGKEYSFAGVGEVKWCTKARDQGNLAGISFVFINEGMKIELRNRICSIPK